MEQRTCNIIMACKRHELFPEADTLLDCVKMYMGKECAYNWKDYTEEKIFSILFEALKDYIDGADKPSFVLWQLNEYGKWIEPDSYTDLVCQKICSLFQMVKVKENNTYINGFTEETLETAEKEVKQTSDFFNSRATELV